MTKFILKTQPIVPQYILKLLQYGGDYLHLGQRFHGLYDYEGTPDSYFKETYYVRNSGPLLRDSIANQMVTKGLSKLTSENLGSFVKDQKLTFICSVDVDRSKATPTFKLRFGNGQDKEGYKTAYLVIGKDKVTQQVQKGKGRGWHKLCTQLYNVAPGNIIKLGRMEFLITEIKADSETLPLTLTQSTLIPSSLAFVIPKASGIERNLDSPSCRICLCDQSPAHDPLISPCKCKGTCENIHVGCLRTWVNSKVKRDCKGVAISYNFTKFDCEICKDPLPQIIKFEDNKELEMLTLNKPSRPYIVLHSLPPSFLSQSSLQNIHPPPPENHLHILSPLPVAEEIPIRLGRNNDSQIKLSDISVSRKHAEIIRKDGEFWIGDCGGKFGTLVKLDGEIEVGKQQQLKIQVGRSLFTFRVRGGEEQGDTE